MLFNKKRVDEDLERIRKANLPDKNVPDKNVVIEEVKADVEEIKLEKGDLLAMILAVLSIILPYLLAFAAIMVGVMFLLGFLF